MILKLLAKLTARLRFGKKKKEKFKTNEDVILLIDITPEKKTKQLSKRQRNVIGRTKSLLSQSQKITGTINDRLNEGPTYRYKNFIMHYRWPNQIKGFSAKYNFLQKH